MRVDVDQNHLQQAGAPIFHERALWCINDIAAYSRYSVSKLRAEVVCLPDFPPAVRITPTSHPRWPAGQVWNFFESRQEKQPDTPRKR